MNNPRSVGRREMTLIELYINCKFEISPRNFYTKWNVDYKTIAKICSRSPSTVRRWFSRGRNYRSPSHYDLRQLALADFLLEHFEDIPSEVFDWLCSSNQEA